MINQLIKFFILNFFDISDRKGNSMLSLTGEIKKKDGALSLNDVSRRYASADSSPAKRKIQLSSSEPCESHDSTVRANHFSPGKTVSKRTEAKTHKVESGDKSHNTQQQQQQQWCTPLLASNAALKRMQSEEKILRRLSEPLGTGTGSGTAMKKTIISPSKDSSLRIVPHREKDRERERGRSSERKKRSASRDVSRIIEGAAASPLKQHQHQHQHQHLNHTEESEYSFEQEREASYLNKHLGISSAEELWQDNVIGVYVCVYIYMCVCVCVYYVYVCMCVCVRVCP